MTPTVDGIVESSLYVKDLDRARDFYQEVFGFPEILREEGRLQALGVAGKQVLLLFAEGRSTEPTDTPGGRIPAHDGHGRFHFALAIRADLREEWRTRLTGLGIAIESEVTCPGVGHSIYFRDPDGNLVELITPGCWRVY